MSLRLTDLLKKPLHPLHAKIPQCLPDDISPHTMHTKLPFVFELEPAFGCDDDIDEEEDDDEEAN